MTIGLNSRDDVSTELRRNARSAPRIMAAGWAVVVAGILSTSGARAATLLVTSTADSGAGSLRAAITSAASGQKMLGRFVSDDRDATSVTG